jgi:hemin uptake protein HemP
METGLSASRLVFSDYFCQKIDMSDESDHSMPQTALPMHDARALLGPDMRAGIMLDGVLYILRLTRSGKLILTK